MSEKISVKVDEEDMEEDYEIDDGDDDYEDDDFDDEEEEALKKTAQDFAAKLKELRESGDFALEGGEDPFEDRRQDAFSAKKPTTIPAYAAPKPPQLFKNANAAKGSLPNLLNTPQPAN